MFIPKLDLALDRGGGSRTLEQCFHSCLCSNVSYLTIGYIRAKCETV